MDFEKNGRIWRTMTGADLSACMDYADEFSRDGQRGPAWVAAFQSRALHMGYRQTPEAITACQCRGPHRPECGYARPTVKAAVIPFDGGDVPILNTDRLPSPTAPAPVDAMPPAPPWKPLAKPRPHFRPKDTGKLFNSLPGDALAGIPESDPDFAFDGS